MLNKKTAERLIMLANKYETEFFLEKDPSQFMHRYSNVSDQEIVAFLSAVTAFGQRKQILSHVELVLQSMGTNPTEWVQSKGYRKFFTEGEKSFYRMYTHNDYLLFFDTLHSFLAESGTIGKHFCRLYTKQLHPLATNCTLEAASLLADGDSKHPQHSLLADGVSKHPQHSLLAVAHHVIPRPDGEFTTGKQETLHLAPLICTLFPKNCHLIPQSKGTAAKRVNMFLRWMVRDNSPVDLGLWAHWYSKGDLLIPLDTHVMQEAAAMGLLELTAGGKIPAASYKTCVQLTSLMDQVFPGDPCRADYALFGLGVDK